MRRFQRTAVVAAALAGLSTLGAGVSFADGYDAPPRITAVANSQATAVATYGGGYDQGEQPHYTPQPAPYPTPTEYGAS